ncbi:MAG TPA: FtsW/RodA/SpoVE family cell cycle protein [Gaiellaceae bacterium]|jgi:rod shape determining protein RodA|nr:FtsW/RodA/SpoVE family cell cycle protein [Gaiellaceae bacterium]
MTIEAVDPRARGLRSRSRDDVAGLVGSIRRIDFVLLSATIGVVAYGIWAIGGITRHDPGGSAAGRQLVYVGAGSILLVAAFLIDPSVYRRFWHVIYLGLCALLGVVLAVGASANGAGRWIAFGSFTFQPSEFGKVLLVLALAAFVADHSKEVGGPGLPLKTIALALGPILLVFLQPDAGTAIVYGSVLAAVLFVSGIRWLYLVLLGAAGLIAVLSVLWWLPAAGVNVLKPYQTQRLTDSNSYNLVESKIAVGAGGVRGRGISGASQTALSFLPSHATDFAFASLAEQRGFFGASVLLLLYLLIIWRGLKIVTTARDLFGAIVAAGIVFAFLVQVFVNVGMTMGIAPITGIPLPFISVGGSSMITNLAAVGILLSIHARGGRRRQ